MTLTYIWWHWPTFDDNDLHFMTLTYIWWHQSHWSGTLCRCPSKFYCLQTVTWYSSGVPLEPLRWQGVCTVACLWQTGPEHLHLQTQESWCNDWPTKRRRRELYNMISSFLEDKVCRQLHFIQIKSLHRLLHGSWSLFLKIIMPYCSFQWTGIQYMTQ